MQLMSPLKNKLYVLLGIGCFFMELASAQEAKQKGVPGCPDSITIKNGHVLDAPGWNYSIPRHFIDMKTNKVKLKDGVFISDFPFPEVTRIKPSATFVTGGLSSSSEEISENMEIYTWDIQEINKYSTAVFFCNLHGDRNETPVPFVFLHQEISKEIKSCTVTYKSENDNRIPESQTLECR